MITVNVMGQLDEILDQVLAKLCYMLLFLEYFDDLLDRPRPMHVFAELKRIVLYLFKSSSELGV